MARSLEDTRIRLRLGEVTCPGNYEVTLTVRSVDTGSGHYDLGGLRGSACVGTVDDIGPHGELRATH